MQAYAPPPVMLPPTIRRMVETGHLSLTDAEIMVRTAQEADRAARTCATCGGSGKQALGYVEREPGRWTRITNQCPDCTSAPDAVGLRRAGTDPERETWAWQPVGRHRSTFHVLGCECMAWPARNAWRDDPRCVELTVDESSRNPYGD